MRGYFGIGIENGKCKMNIGTLWRSANLMEASYIFTIGERYHRQSSDTMKTPLHIPLYHYKDRDAFYENMPKDCPLVGIELSDSAKPLCKFTHPDRCTYILGAEDHGLSAKTLGLCHHLVVLPGRRSMNVAVAGSIVMYSRHIQNV